MKPADEVASNLNAQVLAYYGLPPQGREFEPDSNAWKMTTNSVAEFLAEANTQARRDGAEAAASLVEGQGDSEIADKIRGVLCREGDDGS